MRSTTATHLRARYLTGDAGLSRANFSSTVLGTCIFLRAPPRIKSGVGSGSRAPSPRRCLDPAGFDPSRIASPAHGGILVIRMDNEKQNITLENLAAIMEKGFADLAEDLANMASKDDIANMPTKDDIARLSDQLTGIEDELKSIRLDLRDLRRKVENIEGYRIEIDHAFSRTSAIEKQLGLKQDIAV
jgi:hypothetical protein